MGDLFLQNKALTQTYASPESQPIIRRTNETSASLRKEAGFYENPLETIFKTLTIPQQILYTFGKNLGEELMQKEVTPGKDFFTEIVEAATGKGNITFNKVLESFNLEEIDLALPEDFVIDSLLERIPISVVAGLVSGFATANPIVGITAAFSTNNFLSGQGIATSIGDVVLDPLNKLRIFGQTAKGLGISNKVQKQLIKAGRLEDLVTNGIVRLPKAGTTKAIDDIFEVVVRGKADDIGKILPGGQLQQLGPDKFSVIARGQKELDALKEVGQVDQFSRILKKGEFSADDLDTFVTENSGLSVLGQLLNGDRRLFDFRGNSGFVINDTNPFVGGLLVNAGYRSVDILNPIAKPAHLLDFGLDGLGRMVSKIPGFETIKKLEADVMAPITAKINKGRKTLFAPLLDSGTDFALKFRKQIEINLKDGNPAIVADAKARLIAGSPKELKTTTEQLNFVEKELSDLINTGQQRSSTKTQEIAFKADRLTNDLKNMAVNPLEDLVTSRLGQIGGPEVLQAMEANMKRFLGLTDNDLAKTFQYGSKEQAQQVDHLLDTLEDTRMMQEDVNTFIVKNELVKKLHEAEDLEEIRRIVESEGGKLQSEIPSLTNSTIPTSKLITIEQQAIDMPKVLKLTDTAQQWQMYAGKLDKLRKQLAQEKDSVLKLQKLKNLTDHEQALIDAFDAKKFDATNKNIEVLENALSTTLKIKGIDDVKSMFNQAEAELDIYRTAMELLGTKNAAKIKFQFTNTETLGRKGATDAVVADMIDTSGIKAGADAAIRISNAADVRDGVGLLGDYLLKTLKQPDLDRLLSIVGREGDKGADATNRFLTLFTEIAMNPKGLALQMPSTDASFIGKIVDAFRQFLDYTKSMFFRKEFKNNEMKLKLQEFIKGTDTKKLDGDELFRVKTIVDEKTGNLIDPQGFRKLAAEIESELKQDGLMPVDGGISVTKDGFPFQDLVLLETDAYKQFKIGTKVASIDIANKGHVGVKMYASFQKWLKPHDPDNNFFNPVYEQVVIKDNIISENMADAFQNLTDFSANASAHKVATTIVNRVSAAYDIVPKSAFDNELGLLFKSQAGVLKSKEAVPAVEYMTKFLAYADIKETAKWERKNIENIFDRYNLVGDNTAIDNDFYGDVLNEINLFLKNSPEATNLTEKMRFLKRTLRDNRNIKPEDFRAFNKEIIDLGNEGAEGALKKHLMSYTNSFLEQAGNDLDKTKLMADQFLTKKVAEEFKKVMDSRYEKLSNPSGDGALGSSVHGTILKNIEELEGFSTISQAIEKSRIATFSKDFRRNNVTLVNRADETFSELRGYSVFKAGDNANPLARSLDGTYFPKSLHGVIKQDPKKPYEQMTQLGKLLDNLLSGVSKGQAQDISKSLFIDKLGIGVQQKFTNTLMSANYDYILNLFKAHALLSPAFHARNAISAFFVNSSHGVDPTDTIKGMEAALYIRGRHPQFWGKSFNREQFAIEKSGKVIIKDSTLSAKEADMIELIARSEKGGVLSSGRAQEISADVGVQQMDGGTLNPFSLDFVGIGANAKVAGLTEDAVRMGAMRHAQGVLQYGIEDAANFTKLLHFDYNVLTGAEKSVMKRLIPFYTYTRKALSRDSRMFQERTGEVYALGKMVAAMQSGSIPERQEAVSGFIRDSLGVDVHVDENGIHSYLLLGGLIPAADFVGLAGKVTDKGIVEPSEALKELMFAFMRNASPIIKTPIEQSLNFNFYFNKPIKEVEGELADTFGFAIPANIAAMLQSVRMIRDADKVFHAAFDLKNVTRPDLPNPSELEMGQARTLLRVLGGVNVVDNSKPEDNYYFDRILPLKQRFQEADRNIKRAIRKGFLPNIQNTMEQKQILTQTHQAFLRNEQESLDTLRLLTPKAQIKKKK